VASPDLVRYLAEFDLGLADLRPDQVAMFVAARNAQPYVDPLDVPVGPPFPEASDADLTQREADRVLELTSHADDPLESHLPSDEMDVSLARSVEDLPRVFPAQWLQEEVQPELFYLKLAGRELLTPEWRSPTQGARDCHDQIHQRQLVPEQASDQTPKLHAYVLLDTSRTMRDHDRRGIVARGLALAFFRKGYQNRVTLNLRPFTADAGELSSGIGKEGFHAVVRRVIELPNSGQTRIQAALEQAVADIRAAGPCLGASLMLITDGISRLGKNPLGEEKLNSFIVGDLLEDKSTAGTIATLKEWSRTFHRVWKNRFAEILAPTWPDCQAANLLLQSALKDARDPVSTSEAERLKRLLENVRFLVQEYKRPMGKKAPLPPEVWAMEAELSEAEQRLPRPVEPAPPAAGGQLQPSGRALSPEAPRARGQAVLGTSPSSLWEYVRQRILRIWQRCAAWLGRRP